MKPMSSLLNAVRCPLDLSCWALFWWIDSWVFGPGLFSTMVVLHLWCGPVGRHQRHVSTSHSPVQMQLLCWHEPCMFLIKLCRRYSSRQHTSLSVSHSTTLCRVRHMYRVCAGIEFSGLLPRAIAGPWSVATMRLVSDTEVRASELASVPDVSSTAAALSSLLDQHHPAPCTVCHTRLPAKLIAKWSGALGPSH